MQAVIYCRVSTKEQVDNLSLPTQRRECESYCRREGWEVARVFVEQGESAKTADRTELKRLLAFCREHRKRVGVVVVYNLSRFSRNTADHHALRAVLGGLGVVLKSATEPLDDSPTGRFMETIFSAVAQLDNDVKAERTRAGMRAALDLGRWTWRPPEHEAAPRTCARRATGFRRVRERRGTAGHPATPRAGAHAPKRGPHAQKSALRGPG